MSVLTEILHNFPTFKGKVISSTYFLDENNVGKELCNAQKFVGKEGFFQMKKVGCAYEILMHIEANPS